MLELYGVLGQFQAGGHWSGVPFGAGHIHPDHALPFLLPDLNTLGPWMHVGPLDGGVADEGGELSAGAVFGVEFGVDKGAALYAAATSRCTEAICIE